MWAQSDYEVNLEDYVQQGVFDSSAELNMSMSLYETAYLIDIDNDGVKELYVITCEGSIRQYYGNVFKKVRNGYVLANVFEGNIFPYSYNNETHYISIDYDFETKFAIAIREYSANGLAFELQKTMNILYTYDVSKLPAAMSDLVDNEYLNSLDEYAISDSSEAIITRETGSGYYDVQVTDHANTNTFNFHIELWLTSVGYAPNEWKIRSADDRTRDFKGMEQIIGEAEPGGNESINYGLRFVKDSSDRLYLLKISYPFFTTGDRQDGDLTLELFKFNSDSVVKVEEIILKPVVNILTEVSKAKHI
ncbi:hypothetical protein D3C73_1050300 [compost metagenome]